MTIKTIDEYFGEEPGSFKKFVEKKEKFLNGIENERKERILAARLTAQEIALAA